jgi:hypothetical protein
VRRIDDELMVSLKRFNINNIPLKSECIFIQPSFRLIQQFYWRRNDEQLLNHFFLKSLSIGGDDYSMDFQS